MQTAVQAPHLPLVDTARRRRIDWFEVAVFAALACVSVWVLAVDLWQVAEHHLVWTHTDGEFVVDQMQYLAWIRDAASHVLVSNLFVLRSTPHDYFQPAIAISGAVTRLGVPAWLALLLWKPVAVVGVFAAVRAFCNRLLPERFDRRAALVLALFFGSFGVLGDEWIPFESWGYPFGLIAIAALVGALVAYDRARAEGRVSWVPPLLGLIASLNHPWQGELLIVIVAGTEAFTVRREELVRARVALLTATVAATALPLAYFGGLDRVDSVWRLAQEGARHHYPLVPILVPLLPLLVAAIPAYVRRSADRSFLATATRIWPLAALSIYGLSSTGIAGAPLHSWGGITIPLAVLSVQGARAVGLRRLPRFSLVATALVAAATIPASVHMLHKVHAYAGPQVHNANFIARDERRALRFLRSDPRKGGVLTRSYLGVLVPAETGRRSYLGSCLWSQPACPARQHNAWSLLQGALDPGAARAFVRSTGARFLLQDCRSSGDLRRSLGPLVRSVRRFGCATVYELT